MRSEQSFATPWHRSKPQRHQSKRNVQMPITHTFVHRLGTIRKQICIGRSTPVAWGAHLWFGNAIIVCSTKHRRGRSDPLLLWQAFAH
jgi:hypothetical protein